MLSEALGCFLHTLSSSILLGHLQSRVEAEDMQTKSVNVETWEKCSIS